jgi:hypothetical protein
MTQPNLPNLAAWQGDRPPIVPTNNPWLSPIDDKLLGITGSDEQRLWESRGAIVRSFASVAPRGSSLNRSCSWELNLDWPTPLNA